MITQRGTVVLVFDQAVRYQDKPLNDQFGLVVEVTEQDVVVEVDSSTITRPIGTFMPIVQATLDEISASLRPTEIIMRHIPEALLVLARLAYDLKDSAQRRNERFDD